MDMKMTGAHKDLFLVKSLKEIQQLTAYRVHCWFPDYSITSDGSVHQEMAWDDFVQMHTSNVNIIVQPIMVHDVERGKMIFDGGEIGDTMQESADRLASLAIVFSTLFQTKLNSDISRDWLSKLDNLLKSMSDGIVLINKHQKVIYQNEAFIQFIKSYNGSKSIISEDQLIAMFDEINDLESTDLEAFSLQDVVQARIKVQEKGKIHYFEIKKFGVYEDGNVYSIRDITKEYEIDQIKSNLISIASHEFKTPLTNIRGSVETLLRGDSHLWDESFTNELLQGIHEDVLHLQELIDVWMDVKKIETGTLLLHQDFFPIFQLVKGALNQLPQKFKDQGQIAFHYDSNSTFPLLYGDEARLKQVLTNLIINGLTYNTSEEKSIVIDATHDDDYIYIEVSDNGIGILEKYQKKIFERFYRGDISASRKNGGSGLGLSISQGLIREHHGEIHVKSQLNVGSTFTIQLPIIQVP